MIKTMRNSRIEIWGDLVINDPQMRKPKDVDAIIIQIENSAAVAGNFIVEFISKEDYEKEVSASKTGIVRCKDCNAYTETGPGTGPKRAHRSRGRSK